MKASELRIGNYINGDHIVMGIMLDMIETTKDAEMLLENIEPIPLTEEWLTKLGLEFSGLYWEVDSVNFELINDGDGYYNGVNVGEYSHGIEIKYVHQLQNLYFALTGTELEIK